MSDGESRIADAAESVAAADEAAAAAAVTEAQAKQIDALGETTALTVAAAETASALAKAEAAGVSAAAAETLNQKEDEFQWLRSHATQTDTSLNELRTAQQTQAENQSKMMEALAGITGALQSLTRPVSATEKPPETIKPENQSGDAEGQPGSPRAEAAEQNGKKKLGVRWI